MSVWQPVRFLCPNVSKVFKSSFVARYSKTAPLYVQVDYTEELSAMDKGLCQVICRAEVDFWLVTAYAIVLAIAGLACKHDVSLLEPYTVGK